MDYFKGNIFPELFDDYIFTPKFIKNLLKEATFTSKKVKLTPHEIYFGKREFETNRIYVKALRDKIQESREFIFDYSLDEIITDSYISQVKGELSFRELLKLEWYRFMHLQVLRREIYKLEDILKQLNTSSDAVEARQLIKEVRRIRKAAEAKNVHVKKIVMGFLISYS